MKEDIILKMCEVKTPIEMSVLIGKLCRTIKDDVELANTIRRNFASDTIKKVCDD